MHRLLHIAAGFVRLPQEADPLNLFRFVCFLSFLPPHASNLIIFMGLILRCHLWRFTKILILKCDCKVCTWDKLKMAHFSLQSIPESYVANCYYFSKSDLTLPMIFAIGDFFWFRFVLAKPWKSESSGKVLKEES